MSGERRSWRSSRRSWASTRQREGDDACTNEVSRGLYAEGVARYFETFGRDAVHVVVFEEFVRDTRAEMRRIFEFLGVSAEPLGELVLEAKNRGGVARRRFAAVRAREPSHAKSCRALPGHASSRRMRGHAPGVEPQVRELREPVHAGDREKLESQLARPLPW